MAMAVTVPAVDSQNNHPVVAVGIYTVAHCQPVLQRFGADHYFGDKAHDSSMAQTASSGKAWPRCK